MGLWGGEKLVVGYDLGNEFSQISVAASGSGDVTTLSQTAGEENFNIPTVWCKRIGVNQWFYGKEAAKTEGTFTGGYDDSDMGDTGEGYPMGSTIIVSFRGNLETLSK